MSERVVLCEGVRDRSFWAEWLVARLGWRDLKRGRGRELTFAEVQAEYRSGPGRDWSDGLVSLEPGCFGFARGPDRLRVHPCGSDANVRRALETLLASRDRSSLVHVVACFDSDAAASHPNPAARRMAQVTNVKQRAQQERPNADLPAVSVVVWHTPTPAGTPGVPDEQTLERLVVDCVVAAHGAREPIVTAFLNGARPTKGLAKAHAWSHMAGWFPERGCDDFYRAVWRDPAIVTELQARLTRIGAWSVAAGL